jgi:hypothetical protein
MKTILALVVLTCLVDDAPSRMDVAAKLDKQPGPVFFQEMAAVARRRGGWDVTVYSETLKAHMFFQVSEVEMKTFVRFLKGNAVLMPTADRDGDPDYSKLILYFTSSKQTSLSKETKRALAGRLDDKTIKQIYLMVIYLDLKKGGAMKPETEFNKTELKLVREALTFFGISP